MNNAVLKAVYMIELVSNSNRNPHHSRQHLILTRLPHLTTSRKFHGCSKQMINNRLSIIVAGGMGVHNTPLKSVEYFRFPISDQNQISSNGQSSLNINTQEAIRFERNLPSVEKLQTPETLFVEDISTLNKTIDVDPKKLDGSGWKKLPSLNIPRFRFPSIITINNRLGIAGGKCPTKDISNCNMVEVLDIAACKWTYAKQSLQSIRYNHNAYKLPKSACNVPNPYSFRNQGFNIGHGDGDYSVK